MSVYPMSQQGMLTASDFNPTSIKSSGRGGKTRKSASLSRQTLISDLISNRRSLANMTNKELETTYEDVCGLKLWLKGGPLHDVGEEVAQELANQGMTMASGCLPASLEKRLKNNLKKHSELCSQYAAAEFERQMATTMGVRQEAWRSFLGGDFDPETLANQHGDTAEVRSMNTFVSAVQQKLGHDSLFETMKGSSTGQQPSCLQIDSMAEFQRIKQARCSFISKFEGTREDVQHLKQSTVTQAGNTAFFRKNKTANQLHELFLKEDDFPTLWQLMEDAANSATPVKHPHVTIWSYKPTNQHHNCKIALDLTCWTKQ